MPEPVAPESSSLRTAAFLVIVAVCLIGAGVYVALAAGRGDEEPATPAEGRDLLARGAGTPRVLFQHVARDRDYAHLAVARSDRPGAPRTIAPLVCERAHFAGGRGLCLRAKQGLTGTEYDASVFDEDLRPLHRTTIPGILNRARVSPDGRYGAATGFVAGHSYADAGEFSTHTVLIDMRTGKQIEELERFTATRDDAVVDAADRNFWGVTFAARPGRFYATMATGGQSYLVEGDIAARTMRTLRRNVECPSLSPDGTRIAYKRRVDDGEVTWRLHVLDLSSGADIALAERRMVDDQAEWLDDGRVAYAVGSDVWVVPADGKGVPERLLRDALSPAGLR